MQLSSSRTLRVVFLSLFVVLSSISTVAAVIANVYIYGINQPVQWKGKTFSMAGKTYWAGEIHIKYEGTHTRAYCMEYDIILYTGRTYSYTITDVTDNSTWRAISYVLSWYDPPKDNAEASAVQGAIWKLLTGSDPSGYGGSLALEASDKDTARESDSLSWINPPNFMGPGESVTLKVKLAKSDGSGRANVKIKFETTGGTLDKPEAFTDSNGEATVTLTAPSQIGTVIELKAWSRGVWPNIYLCTDATQDLIGLGDELGLTATTNLCVLTRINVIPDVPFGTITAVAACFLAFIVKNKIHVSL